MGKERRWRAAQQKKRRGKGCGVEEPAAALKACRGRLLPKEEPMHGDRSGAPLNVPTIDCCLVFIFLRICFLRVHRK